MRSETRDQLSELLKERAKNAEARALQSGGTIPPEEYEALQRLARLIEIRSRSAPSPRKLSPVTIAVFGLTLILVSLLFFARVPETEIELDVALSQLGFRLPQQQVLTDVTRLPSLGVSGLTELRLPHAGSREARTIRPPGSSGTAVRLSSAGGQRKGELTLDALNVPQPPRSGCGPPKSRNSGGYPFTAPISLCRLPSKGWFASASPSFPRKNSISRVRSR